MAREADATEATFGQFVFFGLSHRVRFAGDKLDAAGGAATVAATGIELIDTSFISQGQDQTFVSRHFKGAVAFHG